MKGEPAVSFAGALQRRKAEEQLRASQPVLQVPSGTNLAADDLCNCNGMS